MIKIRSTYAILINKNFIWKSLFCLYYWEHMDDSTSMIIYIQKSLYFHMLSFTNKKREAPLSWPIIDFYNKKELLKNLPEF